MTIWSMNERKMKLLYKISIKTVCLRTLAYVLCSDDKQIKNLPG